jgi:BirA family biotin operon repressor/biotin-[acetyl-CoA-carboxylase] ligase
MRKIPLLNPFGAPVYRVETTSSTMDESRRLANRGAVHGTVIIADFQEAGRGRIQSRPWIGRAGENLFATILLRYPGISAVPKALTLRTGLAIALAVEDFAPPLTGAVEVKWPNDIMVGSGEKGFLKAAGILTEGDGKTLHIGFGVNLCQSEFPEALRHKATSIALALRALPFRESGPQPPQTENPVPPPARTAPPPPSPEDRFVFLEKILLRLFQELETPGPEPEPGLKPGPDKAASWRHRLGERLYKRGETVRFIAGSADSGRVVEGRLSGVGTEGELLILPEGAAEALAFITGELDVYGR